MTKYYGVQIKTDSGWMTIGSAQGTGPDVAFAAFADGKSSGAIEPREAEFDFPRFDVGAARFRLVRCRKGEVVI